MRDALTTFRRLAAALVVALAVVAMAGAVHARRHVACAPHSISHDIGQVALEDNVAIDAEGNASMTHDASGCSCPCHGGASGLGPTASAPVSTPRAGSALPRLAEIPPASVRPDGPRRPPRLP